MHHPPRGVGKATEKERWYDGVKARDGRVRRLLVVATIGLVACGSDDDGSDPLEFDHPGTRPLAACADASSEDAFVLALRYQTGIRYNERLASDYAWALNSARAAYPTLCEPRAFADVSPDVVRVRANHPRVLDAWRNGRIATGVWAVDAVLESVDVARIEPESQARTFVLTLAQPVNARALAQALDDTRAVDATAERIDASNDFFFDGHAYVSRAPSDIIVRSGERATGFTFKLANGGGRVAVVVHHNGVVGQLANDQGLPHPAP